MVQEPAVKGEECLVADERRAEGMTRLALLVVGGRRKEIPTNRKGSHGRR